MGIANRIDKIKSKFARQAIKEIATQISEIPDEPKSDKEEPKMENTEDKFISKRDLWMFLGGMLAGYLLFHNTFRISSREIKEKLP